MQLSFSFITSDERKYLVACICDLALMNGKASQFLYSFTVLWPNGKAYVHVPLATVIRAMSVLCLVL